MNSQLLPPCWKELKIHYELHTTSNLVARHTRLRQLQFMRVQQEQRLVRVKGSERRRARARESRGSWLVGGQGQECGCARLMKV